MPFRCAHLPHRRPRGSPRSPSRPEAHEELEPASISATVTGEKRNRAQSDRGPTPGFTGYLARTALELATRSHWTLPPHPRGPQPYTRITASVWDLSLVRVSGWNRLLTVYHVQAWPPADVRGTVRADGLVSAEATLEAQAERATMPVGRPSTW